MIRIPLLTLASCAALALCSLPARAGSDFSVTMLEFHGKIPGVEKPTNTDIVMPFVLGTDPRVEANINDALFTGQLEVAAPRHPGKFLSEADGIKIDGLASQAFTTLRNDERILSIEFTGEGCGAYCEGFTTHYNFDLQTGRQLSLDDLVTARGQQAIARKLAEAKRDAYRTMIDKLNAELKQERASKVKTERDMGDETQERIDFNKDCLDRANSALAELGKTKDAPLAYYADFALGADKFILQLGRCSNHAMRAIDDVGELSFELTYAELRPHLTSYGLGLLFKDARPQVPGSDIPLLCTLFKDNKAQSPCGIYGIFLHGTMDGKTAITMRLFKNANNEVNGAYYYDKYRQLIRLNGHEQGGKLELAEELKTLPGSETQTAALHLSVTGNHVQGKWVGKSEHQIDLAP